MSIFFWTFLPLAGWVVFAVIGETVDAIQARRERRAEAALERHVQEALAVVEPVPPCGCGECDG